MQPRSARKPCMCLNLKERVLPTCYSIVFFTATLLIADTLYIEKPVLEAYKDRTYPPLFESKIGAYPHQKLLKAASTIMLKGMVVNGATINYTEKGEKSGEEGTLNFTDLNLRAANITNDSNRIKQNGKCVVTASGKIFNTSPITAKLNFYLDSTNGWFDANGTVDNVSAAQLKPGIGTTGQCHTAIVQHAKDGVCRAGQTITKPSAMCRCDTIICL